MRICEMRVELCGHKELIIVSEFLSSFNFTRYFLKCFKHICKTRILVVNYKKYFMVN